MRHYRPFYAGGFLFMGFALLVILALAFAAFSVVFGAGGSSRVGLLELAVLCLGCLFGLGLLFGMFALFRFAFWKGGMRHGWGGWRHGWGDMRHHRGHWGGRRPGERGEEDEAYPEEYL